MGERPGVEDRVSVINITLDKSISFNLECQADIHFTFGYF